MDIKYLTDIDNHPYFDTQNLAKYQIIARDIYTGFPNDWSSLTHVSFRFVILP